VEEEVWVELEWDVGKQLLAEFIESYQFRLGVESKDWPAIIEPTPSVTWEPDHDLHWSLPGRVRRWVS
jgi:hypothetical protein